MTPFHISNWIRSLSRPVRRPIRTRPSTRPRVESLEDRVVPSPVASYFDATSLPSNVRLLGNAGHDYLADGSNGWLDVTRARYSQTGSVAIDHPQGRAATEFSLTAAISIKDGWRPDEVNVGDADGMSFGYGAISSAFGEAGSGSGLWVSVNTYNSPGVHVYFNGSIIQSYSTSASAVRGGFMPVSLVVTETGTTTLSHPAIGTRIFTVPGWAPQASWDFGFGARTGGFTDAHVVEHFIIQDRTPPTFTFAGSHGNVTTSAIPAFSWTLSDPASNLASAKVVVTKNGQPLPPVYPANGSGSLSLNQFGTGTYVLSATTTDIFGVQRSPSPREVVVTDTFPVAAFTVSTPPASRLEGATVQFNGSGSSDFDGPLVAYVWDMGDGTYLTGPTVSHTYADNGTYTVKLRVRDSLNQQHMVEQSVTIGNVDPTITGTAPAEVDEAAPFELTLSPIVDPGRETPRILVNWGDGVSEEFTSAGLKRHVYSDGGLRRTVRVSVADEDGVYADRIVHEVEVRNAAPRVNLPAFFTGQAGAATAFAADILESPSDGLVFAWDFGDGATASGSAVSHVYAVEGVFALTLIVADTDGFTSTATSQVVIGTPVSFTTAAQTETEGGTVIVTARLDRGVPLDHPVVIPLVIDPVFAADYTLPAGQIVIPAGRLFGGITLRTTDDVLDEDDEVLRIRMGLPTGASHGAVAEQWVTVRDNDNRPTVFFTTAGQVFTEADQEVELRAELSEVSGRDVSVSVAFSGTATFGSDFTSPSVIVIPAGSLAGGVRLRILEDLQAESSESIVANLSASEQADIAPAPGRPTTVALVVRQNDSPVVSLDGAYRLTAEGIPSLRIIASMNRFSLDRVEVPFTLASSGSGGQAISGTDYEIAAAKFIFEPGTVVASVTVAITDDLVAEGTESFVIRLGTPSPSLVTLGTSQLVTTAILDNDVVRVSFDAGDRTAWEGNGSVVPSLVPVRVVLSGPSAQPVTVKLTFSGTAMQDTMRVVGDYSVVGSGYNAATGLLTIPAGQTTAAVSIRLREDQDNEPTKTIQTFLSVVSGAVPGEITSRSIYVQDNDPIISLESSEAAAEGRADAPLVVRLSAPSNLPVTVRLKYSGSALQGVDYTGPDEVVVPAGQTAVAVPITVIDDTMVEGEESFRVKAWSAKDFLARESDEIILRMLDNDRTDLTWTTTSRKIQEETGSITQYFALSQPAAEDVTVYFEYVEGEAVSVFDFTPGPAFVTIPAGQTIGSVTLPLTNDLLQESAETFTLVFRSATLATLPADPAARRLPVTILDIDQQTTVQLASTFQGLSAPSLPSIFEFETQLSTSPNLDPEAAVDTALTIVGFAVGKLLGSSPAGVAAGLVIHTVKYLAKTYPDGNGWINGNDLAEASKNGSLWRGLAAELAREAGRLLIADQLSQLLSGTWIADGVNAVGEFLGIDEAGEYIGTGIVKVVEIVSEDLPDAPSATDIVSNIKNFFGGYGDGATVFFDTNFDGRRSGDEPFGITSADGRVFIHGLEAADANGNGLLDQSEGRWVGEGGTDTSVGLQFQMALTAPANYAMITPSSTVVEKLVQIGAFPRTGNGIRSADTRYLQALGLPDRPIAFWDFVADAAQGNADAARLFARETQLYNAVVMAAAFFEGRAPGLPFAFLADVTITDIAEKIAGPGSALDMANDAVVAAVLRGVAVRIGATLSNAELDIVARAIASANRLIEGRQVEGSRDFLEDVMKVHRVAQGELSTSLGRFARGEISAASLQSATDGLVAAVGAASAGNVLPVYVSTFSTSIFEGDAGERYLEFVVTPYGDPTLPFSVAFRTVAGTATEGLDYEGSNGMLVWAAGDSTPQTVRVRLFGDTAPEVGETFSLMLSDAVNATVFGAPAVGTIANDDAFVYSSPIGQDENLTLSVNGPELTLARDGEVLFTGTFEAGGHIRLEGQAADRFQLFARGASLEQTIAGDDARTIQVGGHTLILSGIVALSDELAVGIAGFPLHLFESKPVALSVTPPVSFDPAELSFLWRAVNSDGTDVEFANIATATYTPSQTHRWVEVVITDGVRTLTVRHEVFVLPSNVAPVANTDAVSTGENLPLAVDPTANDTDLNPEDRLSVVPGSVAVVGITFGGQPVTLAGYSMRVSGNTIQFDTGTAFDFLAAGESATVTIRYTVTDDGTPEPLSADGELMITIDGTNDAPTGAAIAVNGSLDEGSMVTLAASAVEVDRTDTLRYAWVVYAGNPTTPYATGDGSNWAFTPHDDGDYRIVLTVSDGLSGTVTTERNVPVRNVAPTVSLTAPATASLGQPILLTATIADPGTADAHTVHWTVTRNGVPVDLTGLTTHALGFGYTPVESGLYVVTAIVEDNSGDSGAATHTITVTVPTLATVTLISGRLTIVGTDSADDIRVVPNPQGSGVTVSVNGATTTLAYVADIAVYGNGGDDWVQVAGGVTAPVTAFGGAGNDRLKAGGGASVLVGGDGDDSLLGGAGRDVLIGGRGADLIGGNGADDLLVAGNTLFDANVVALALVRAEWSSERSFADRVANLSGTSGTGLNGPVVLTTTGEGKTVFDDNAVDRLTGDAGNDWFVFNSLGGVYVDRATDLSAFEGLFDVDV
jgi:hypothetical protein